MGSLTLGDTGLSANKSYGAVAIGAQSQRQRFKMAEIRLVTSAAAGNRRVQLIVRPSSGLAIGHGLVVCDTGVVATPSTTVFGTGGTTNTGSEAGAGSHVQWFQFLELNQQMILDAFVSLQAGDTFDVSLVGDDLEDGEGI